VLANTARGVRYPVATLRENSQRCASMGPSIFHCSGIETLQKINVRNLGNRQATSIASLPK
jgi:hypothetical protein